MKTTTKDVNAQFWADMSDVTKTMNVNGNPKAIKQVDYELISQCKN